MSTNTTNTSDPSGKNVGSSDPEPVNDPAGLDLAALNALPNVLVIAKLANEFFAALPTKYKQVAPVPGAAAENVPRDVSGHTGSPQESEVTMLQSPALPEADSLAVADLRDIAHSMADVTGLLRSRPPGVPTPPITSESSYVPERGGPWASTPSFPSQSGMFAFPGLPVEFASKATQVSQSDGLPAAATSAPKSNLALTPEAKPEGKNPFVTSAVAFPATTDLFLFPGVPGTQSVPAFPLSAATPPIRLPEQNETRGTTLRTPVPSTPGPLSSEAGQSALPSDPAALDFDPEVVPNIGIAKRPLDPELLRRDFPILQERVHGRRLIWLDNAATTQKPNAVIDRLSHFYRHENSNIHRAAHTLAARATDAYESAREKTRRFLNASSTREVIFVRGTTEGINLVAQSWGRRNVNKDDEVVITWLEHHANILPWQQLCAEKGARLRVAPVNDRGEVILEEYERLLGPRTRIVAFSHVSNALGTITPAREMTEMAHRHGARVLVDGAQAVSHMRTDVQVLDCDFYVFSGHKVFGPTGIGVMYGKSDVLDAMPPWQGGGNMIVDVAFDRTVYQSPPAKFEAGTGNIADAVGLGAALDYVEQVGIDAIASYEHQLLAYATAALMTVPGLRLIGTAKEKAGVLSFVLDDMRTEDVGAALNQQGIAVRSGHHCAQPILRRFGLESTVRPSLAFYNTCEEIDELVAALLRIKAGRGR